MIDKLVQLNEELDVLHREERVAYEQMKRWSDSYDPHDYHYHYSQVHWSCVKRAERIVQQIKEVKNGK